MRTEEIKKINIPTWCDEKMIVFLERLKKNGKKGNSNTKVRA